MPESSPLLPAELPADDVANSDIETFIAKWKQGQAAELANAQGFLIDLCRLLGVPGPNPATKNPANDAFVFERPVVFQDGAEISGGRIDLYKRGCFVLETKQGVDEERKMRGKMRSSGHGTRGSAAWERAIKAAKEQAARYARNLDVPTAGGIHTEPIPPLVIACDVGYCIDLYANFGHPQRYSAFPDQRGYRILIDDLFKAEARATLRLAFTDPHALDPSRRQAQVTRQLAETLAELASEFEGQGHSPDAVFGFLTRCLFTMFAEDTDLLPAGSFTTLLKEYRDHLDVLPDALEALWTTMDSGGFSPALKARIRRFNGRLFVDRTALSLTANQLNLLLDASNADWTNVEPAIFGTLLERALDPRERHSLGAHYTPRAYVERLVLPTVIDPLREEWDAVQVAVARLEEEHEESDYETDRARSQGQRTTRKEIIDLLAGFLRRLTTLRVLDPACGSGNFLYVTLEHLKRLEAEVKQVMQRYGEASLEMEQAAVTPAQLLGIEINPRAAAIADLVLWIGFLQWHLRTYGGPHALADPVLHAYGNIECRDAVLTFSERTPRTNAVGEPESVWDGITTKSSPTTGQAIPDESARRPVYDYADPRPASWPDADFIVGNPPFLGGKDLREALGDGYAEAIRTAYPDVPNSVDLVMYWWHKAAKKVRYGNVERFGFITTNSITQTFNRRVVENHIVATPSLSIVFAIPDHPWVDNALGAAVRVSMTVAISGSVEGQLATVCSEIRSSNHEARVVELSTTQGQIFANLTVGVDITGVKSLRANGDLSDRGVQLYGSGFILELDEAERLGINEFEGIRKYIRPYRNGNDIVQTSRKVFAIDLFGLTADEVRERLPAIYQHVHDSVKPARDQSKEKRVRENWWLHGRTRPRLREALIGVPRYIVTVETSKHHTFQFLDSTILPDNSLVVIASYDAFHLGILSSHIHEIWALGAGGTLEDRPRYQKTQTFEPFPFPAATEEQQEEIRAIAESLDELRASRLAEHPSLTMTGLYNVLTKVRTGESLSEKDKKVYELGFVGILKEHHDRLDKAVADAYGWSDLYPLFPKQEVLRRLVALNAERQAEEAAGLVRWLRPSFQDPEGVAQAELGMAVETVEVAASAKEREPWPVSLPERARAIRRVLSEASVPATAEAVARSFHNARRRDVSDLLDTLVELGQARLTEGGAYAT